MPSVVGVFTSRTEALDVARRLESTGVAPEHITLLVPDGEADPARVPTVEAEHPAVGTALGGVVGGATGAAAGVTLGAAMAAVLPGVGPVLLLGAAAAGLLGAGGVLGGAAVARAAGEAARDGLPRDEFYVYQDALRLGRSVIIVLPRDTEQAEAAREVLTGAGAESIDQARERWWIGLRSAEEARYEREFGNFTRDEALYREGFQAALRQDTRGMTFTEAEAVLRAELGDACADVAFRRGFERGQAHEQALRQARDARP
jgi:hypothetical protein